MRRGVWVISVFLATIFLLGNWIPQFSAPTNYYSSSQPVLASTHVEPITPAERKEMESLALEFTKRYYSYTLENYLEEGEKLLPLLTQDYQESYQEALIKSFSAAKASDAESSVESLLILSIEKVDQDTGVIEIQFKARVLTHEVETLNRYNVVLELKKEAGVWLINDILEEEPVAFSNLQGLL